MIWSLVPLPCRNPACSCAISVSVFTRIISSVIRRRILLACETSNCSVICTLFNVILLGKWDERAERLFLWPLVSFPDSHTYSVHSVQYCLSCFEQFCWDLLKTCDLLSDGWYEQPLKWWRLLLPIFLFSSFPSFIMVQVCTITFHLSAICTASVKFSPVADCIHYRRGWNFLLIDLTIWKSCRKFPFGLAASNSIHMPSSCCCLSILSFLCTLAFNS